MSFRWRISENSLRLLVYSLRRSIEVNFIREIGVEVERQEESQRITDQGEGREISQLRRMEDWCQLTGVVDSQSWEMRWEREGFLQEFTIRLRKFIGKSYYINKLLVWDITIPLLVYYNMLQDQTIIFVAQAKMVLKGSVATIKRTEETLQTGFVEKKVVMTTSKLYVFESPHTDAASTEFRIKKEKELLKLGKDKVKKQYYSVTGTPQRTIEVLGKQGKALIEPNERFNQYVKAKLPIFNQNQIIKNVGILSDSTTQRNDLLFFHTAEATLRFAKAWKAHRAWNIYLASCRNCNIPFNIEWAIFLQDFVYKDKCIFAIDPIHYHDGVNEELEMNCFIVLVENLTGISGLEFKFMIKDDYGYQCCEKFMKGIKTMSTMRMLIFEKCEILDAGLVKILSKSETLTALSILNLSHNKLTDLSFQTLMELLSRVEYLKYLDLSHNQITLSISQSFYAMLKQAKQQLVLDFSYNNINDNSIQNIQNNILLPINPPIQEINISYNKFSKDGEWRLFAMNMQMEPYHTRMTFIIYPVPFHVDIFKNMPLKKWPVKSNQDYFSSLMIRNILQSPKASSVNQRSLLSLKQSEIRRNPSSNNSRRQDTETFKPKIGIKISRSTTLDKQPARSEQLDEITRVKNQLVIMVQSKNVPLETFYNKAKEISSYSFSFPTIALQPISAWLGEKMNEALRIRDHESIDLIYESCQMLGVSLNVYKERLERVERRKELFCYRLYNLFNFNMNEMELVPQLQQLIKESLRLCLKGTAIDLLYYIKYLKDQKIKTFIKNQYSPYVELQDRRTESYAKLYDNAAEVREEIPLALRKMTQINTDLYDYYLEVNYFLLAMISSDDYDRLVLILRELSSSHPEFSKFINQAFQRINFIVTEFYKSFIYSVFSVSYFELKINSCRLVWQYNNIKKSVLYSDLPNFPKKAPITPQKYIKIPNEAQFQHEFSILRNYDNIKAEVIQRGIMGYKSVYTRYIGKLFQEEVKKLCQQIVKLFQAISADVMNSVHDDVVKLLIELIQFIRGCTHVRQLLEELYLHVICFDIQDKRLLLKIIPIMTMYLRPPEAIEYYLIAFLSRNKYSFELFPLSVEFTKNPVNKFVDRDWLPTHQQMKELIRTNGKVNIPIRTTEGKIRFMIQIFESKTVGDLMKEVYEHPVLAEYPDKSTFWIYKHNLVTNAEEIILYDDYVGELISSYKEDKEEFIVRRRIYSPYYVINFHKYTDSILNSIYHQVKHFYLLGVAYIVFDNSQSNLGALIAIIDVLEESIKNSRDITFQEKDFKLFTEGLREKIAQILPIKTRNQRTFKISSAIAQIKQKISQQFKTPFNLTIQKLQRRFLDQFRNSHYYCSSNYEAYLYQQSQKCLVSINSQYISIETITDQKNIFYESLLSLCPDENFLNIFYYDKEKLETVEVVLEIKARISLAIVMDVLSYCVMRLYTSNMYIYLQRELHETLFRYAYPLSAFDLDKQERGEQAIMAELKHRRGQSNASRKQVITNLNMIIGKLRAMELGIYKENDFIFQQQMKFSKWELNREVFPFRSERLLPKSEIIRKSDMRQDESNYEGSVTNKEKDADDLESLNIIRMENDEIFEEPDEEVESPLLPYKPREEKEKEKEEKEEEKRMVEDPEFNMFEVSNSEVNMKGSRGSRKNEMKVEVPKIEIPKIKESIPKFTLPPKPPVEERQVEPPPLTRFKQEPKMTESKKSDIPKPVAESPKEKVEVITKPPSPPVQPPITIVPPRPPTPPVVQPVVPKPVQVQPPIVTPPVVPTVPPVEPNPVPVQEPKPAQQQETVTVIKPRNSNKMYDRTSRRRAP